MRKMEHFSQAHYTGMEFYSKSFDLGATSQRKCKIYIYIFLIFIFKVWLKAILLKY